ncbi:hypothetical protein, partial [Halomicronema sp. CCY15110]|uniref:hypothetical protein n=1 Tax=Halomicronema sp. CCY15110 TaxID=2767773 RepID=UPI0019525652
PRNLRNRVAERLVTCSGACLGGALGILFSGGRSWSDYAIALVFVAVGLAIAALASLPLG